MDDGVRKINNAKLAGVRDGNRTRTPIAGDFKSPVSTYSTTRTERLPSCILLVDQLFIYLGLPINMRT